MAVIVQYIVEIDGIQKMTFDNKKDAEAYDKILEITADLWVFLEGAKVTMEDKQMEDLCMFMAKNKDQTMAILKGGKSADIAAKPAKVKDKPAGNKAKEKETAPEMDSMEPKAESGNKNKTKAA